MVFEQERLLNGITVYRRASDTEYTIVYLQVPVGTAHNTGNVLPGSSHFLEHICFERSKRHPELAEFSRLVGLYGGHSNAHTYAFRTTYELSVPNHHLAECLPGLFAAAFEPQMSEDSILSTKTIISSERRRNRWYPGSSEVGKYINTSWLYDSPYPIEQLYGSDDDLERMTVERLMAAHAAYFSPDILVVAVGNGNLKPLTTLLEALQVQARELPNAYMLTYWVKREYHEKAFRDVNRFELRYANFRLAPPDPRTLRQISFIGNYFVNSVHGPLYRWLRHELGWAYDLSFSFNSDRFGYDWRFYIPLGDLEQVAAVRREAWDRMREALGDAQEVGREIDRILDSSCYWHPTPGSILNEAMGSLSEHGRIVTSSEWREHIESCRDIGNLARVFEERYAEQEVGSFCAVPE